MGNCWPVCSNVLIWARRVAWWGYSIKRILWLYLRIYYRAYLFHFFRYLLQKLIFNRSIRNVCWIESRAKADLLYSGKRYGVVWKAHTNISEETAGSVFGVDYLYIFTTLHGVISQKTVIFIVTALDASNVTLCCSICAKHKVMK
jgi:hypothetical protein